MTNAKDQGDDVHSYLKYAGYQKQALQQPFLIDVDNNDVSVADIIIYLCGDN
jgi:hypothetical protein